MPMPMMMMMMIPSSSTVVDVHTDARRSTSSTSSRCSSSRRASFVRSPSVVAHDCRRARIPSHASRPITTPVGRRAVPGVRRRKKGCVHKLHTLDRIVRRICPSAYVRLIRTHTPYCTSVCPNARTHRSVAASARPDDPTTRRPRERDARTTTTSDLRTRATGDHVGRVTVRVTVHAQGARDDETRRTMEWNGWMDGRATRGTRDGWMMRWGRDDEDERWLEGERGTGGWETIGSGVCRRAWGGKTASERTRRRG